MEWWQKIIAGHSDKEEKRLEEIGRHLDAQTAREKVEEERKDRERKAQAKRSGEHWLKAVRVTDQLRQICKEVWRGGEIKESSYTETFGYVLEFSYPCPAEEQEEKTAYSPGSKGDRQNRPSPGETYTYLSGTGRNYIVPGLTYLEVTATTGEDTIFGSSGDIEGYKKYGRILIKSGLIDIPLYHGREFKSLLSFPDSGTKFGQDQRWRHLSPHTYSEQSACDREALAYMLALDCRERVEHHLMPADLQKIAAVQIREHGITEWAR